jgi:large subunit ribosomal protein L22
MMTYSYKTNNENIARAYGRGLPISNKQSIEICDFIRNRKVERAKTILENVITKEQAVPMRKFNRDTAHKKGIGPGKYPINAAKEILHILKSAESNAQSKGLATTDLTIIHISANKASQPWHSGRQRRSRMKRTHVQIVLGQQKPKTKEGDKK